MLILIDILCVYVLNVDVLLFSTGSQDVMIKMTINIPFFQSVLRPKSYTAGVFSEISKFVALVCCNVKWRISGSIVSGIRY
jgi:hypothetical protein